MPRRPRNKAPGNDLLSASFTIHIFQAHSYESICEYQEESTTGPPFLLPTSNHSVAKQQSPNRPMPTTHPPTDPPTEKYGFFKMRTRDWASSLIYTEWQRHHREGKFSNHKPIKAPSSHFRLRSFEQTEPHKSANNCNLIII